MRSPQGHVTCSCYSHVPMERDPVNAWVSAGQGARENEREGTLWGF